MTVSVTTRNPNTGFPISIAMLKENGRLLPSRNGDCLEYPEPVSFTFTHPLERVLSHPTRRINPFLHYFEPFWILAGRNDVGYLAQFTEQFRNYSDDGETFAAAYGHRLRYPQDQIQEAIERLRANPDDRQVVLQIRTPEEMFYRGKDTACNISAALKVRDGRLNMHVFNRSNDVIWGGPAGGTNHPQFTTLLEYVAGHVGVGIGNYTVTTDSMHAYVNEQWEKVKDTLNFDDDPYLLVDHQPAAMMGEPAKFDVDLYLFFSYDKPGRSLGGFTSTYFNTVFEPMLACFESYKLKNGLELELANEIGASDWHNAVVDFFAGIPRLQERL